MAEIKLSYKVDQTQLDASIDKLKIIKELVDELVSNGADKSDVKESVKQHIKNFENSVKIQEN